ncbi:hypothetical protein PRZ48_008881 [Zasmidium cellare]|uniref:Uncharacterized protein n=1 Tax=Zasmidium cellare TaxID=395010 RepID=A0ABR0EGQ5_ZASCE|nr:hypothetical protein PRZ48_008881 [Zasmidium cellare]
MCWISPHERYCAETDPRNDVPAASETYESSRARRKAMEEQPFPNSTFRTVMGGSDAFTTITDQRPQRLAARRMALTQQDELKDKKYGSDFTTTPIDQRLPRLTACNVALSQRSEIEKARDKLDMRERTVAWREAQVLEREKDLWIRERKLATAEAIEKLKKISAEDESIKPGVASLFGGSYKFPYFPTVLRTSDTAPQHAGFTTKEIEELEREIAKIQTDKQVGFTMEEIDELEKLIAKVERDENVAKCAEIGESANGNRRTIKSYFVTRPEPEDVAFKMTQREEIGAEIDRAGRGKEDDYEFVEDIVGKQEENGGKAGSVGAAKGFFRGMLDARLRKK